MSNDVWIKWEWSKKNPTPILTGMVEVMLRGEYQPVFCEARDVSEWYWKTLNIEDDITHYRITNT